MATLNLNGDLTFSSGLIDIKVGAVPLSFIGGSVISDLIKVSGSSSFSGGQVEIDFINGYTPKIGDSLAWLTAMADNFSGLNTLNYTATGLANGEVLAFSKECTAMSVIVFP